MQLSKPLPHYITDFMQVFRENGYLVYLVGGPVRDLLLDRPISNWDFTTNATPDQMMTIFPDAKCNNDFGTVMMKVENGDEKILCEVTPFRKEGTYSDSRHPDSVEWAQTLEEDVQRRDVTINALATDGEEVIDYVNGLADLKDKVVRAVGNADRRFEEDALRLIRAIRFATQLEFLIEKETQDAIVRNADRITRISWERIRDEFLKILESDHPAEGVLFLKQTGLLQHILPEVEACFAIEQKSPERHHIYDVGTHSIEALRHCPSKDAVTRLATLIHDIGKVNTRAVDEKTGVVTFYNHETVGATMAEEIADRLRLSKKQKEKLVLLVRHHMFTVSETVTDNTLRRFIRTVGKEHIDEIVALRIGDRIGSGAKPTSWRTELFKKRLIEVQKQPFTVSDLKITGHDVMEKLDIKPGPEIGRILNEIFEKVVEGKLKNTRAVLLKELTTK